MPLKTLNKIGWIGKITIVFLDKNLDTLVTGSNPPMINSMKIPTQEFNKKIIGFLNDIKAMSILPLITVRKKSRQRENGNMKRFIVLCLK